MTRLSKREKRTLKTVFCEWQDPRTMAETVDQCMNGLGSVDLFTQAGLEFVREAWTAAKFAQLRGAAHVRLIADEWPDFELRYEGKSERFELIEADDPDRRRGDEYRERIGEVSDDPVEDWIARAEKAAVWMDIACRKKMKKNYGSRANLLILLNLNEFGIRQQEVESTFPAVTAIVKNQFESVWVLWKEKAYMT